MLAVYIICGIILLVALLAFTVTTVFENKAEIVIDKPKAEVFEFLKSLKNQRKWKVWDQLDPNMKQEFTGIDSTVGFIEAWDGNKKAGKGAQEIKKIKEGERIDIEMRFEKPFKLTNGVYFATSSIETNKTNVVFCLYGNSPRPFNLLFPFMKASMIKDLNRGLLNLKEVLEK